MLTCRGPHFHDLIILHTTHTYSSLYSNCFSIGHASFLFFSLWGRHFYHVPDNIFSRLLRRGSQMIVTCHSFFLYLYQLSLRCADTIWGFAECGNCTVIIFYPGLKPSHHECRLWFAKAVFLYSLCPDGMVSADPGYIILYIVYFDVTLPNFDFPCPIPCLFVSHSSPAILLYFSFVATFCELLVPSLFGFTPFLISFLHSLPWVSRGDRQRMRTLTVTPARGKPCIFNLFWLFSPSLPLSLFLFHLYWPCDPQP